MRLTQPNTRDRSTAEAVGLPASPRHKPGKLYIYVHFEQSWYWTEAEGPDGERLGWLPRPSNVPAEPGVNGVQDPGGRKPVTIAHMAGLMASLTSKGAKLLMPEDVRLGDYQFYDRYYDIQGGGRWYVEPGQEATVLSNGTILWNSDDIIAHMTEFHRFLRDEAPSLIHPFRREIYQQMIGREQERLSRYVAAAGVTPGLGYRVERQQQKIELMAADFAAYEASLGSEPAPAPKLNKGAEPKATRKVRLSPRTEA